MHSDYAYISLWFRPFEGVILRVSGPEMGNIMCSNGAFCMTGRIVLHTSRWYSVYCAKFLFLAYLRPTGSQFANTRLFLGVE